MAVVVPSDNDKDDDDDDDDDDEDVDSACCIFIVPLEQTCLYFSICACHLVAGAMLIFSVSFPGGEQPFI